MRSREALAPVERGREVLVEGEPGRSQPGVVPAHPQDAVPVDGDRGLELLDLRGLGRRQWPGIAPGTAAVVGPGDHDAREPLRIARPDGVGAVPKARAAIHREHRPGAAPETRRPLPRFAHLLARQLHRARLRLGERHPAIGRNHRPEARFGPALGLFRVGREVHEGHHDAPVVEHQQRIHVEPPFPGAVKELHRADPASAVVFRAEDAEAVLAAVEDAQVEPSGEGARRLVRRQHRVVVGSAEIERRGPGPSSVLGSVRVQERPGASGLVRPRRERGEDRRARPGEGDLGIAPAHLLLLGEDDVLPLHAPVEAHVGLGSGASVGTGEGDRACEQIPRIPRVGCRHDLDVGPVAVPADEVVGPDHDPGLLAGVGAG